MSKRLARMAENPRAGWSISDVEAVCREFGIMCEPPRGGGSHFKVWHPALAEILTVPSREERPVSKLAYPVIVSPLPEAEGGGFVATVPDLPGCMSDGETPEEAITNVLDAIDSWIEAAHDAGRQVPAPSRVAAIA